MPYIGLDPIDPRSSCVCGLAVREQKIAVFMNRSRLGTPF